MSALTPQQKTQWEEEGYLLLRGIVPAENIAAMRSLYERVTEGFLNELKAEGLITDTGEGRPLENRFLAAGEHAKRYGRSWRQAIAYPELYHLQCAKPLVDAVSELIEGDVVGSPIFNARPKLPGQELTVVPWHQDSAYSGEAVRNSQIISCWIPFVPATEENGCLQGIRGSHRLDMIPHHTEKGEGQFLEATDITENPENIVTFTMEPGDALFFPYHFLHRSLPGEALPIRWSVDLRYAKEGASLGTGDWTKPGLRWMIRSHTESPTTLEQWQELLPYVP